MASYDKGKLLKLLERKRAAYMVLLDIMGREREAHTETTRLIGLLRAGAQRVGAFEIAERLLSLPADKALAVPQDEVTGYVPKGKNDRYSTGFDLETWHKYISVLSKRQRLIREREQQQETVNAEFVIVEPLLAAVREWGFRNPSLEV